MAIPPVPTPRVSVPNVAEVALKMRLYTQECVNTFAFAFPTQPTSANMQDLATLVVERVLPVYRLATSTDLVFESVRVQDLLVPTQTSVERAITGSIRGQIGSAGMPGNVTLAVSKRTGRAGRSYRGRFFLPGIPTNAVFGDTVSASYQVLAQNVGLAWLGVGDDGTGWRAVVASTLRGIATYVLSIITESLLDSMRRRLASRGVL